MTKVLKYLNENYNQLKNYTLVKKKLKNDHCY